MKLAEQSIQTNTYFKIAYFVCLSIAALGLMFFDFLFIRGKAGCSQRECLNLVGSYTVLLSLGAIIGLPVYTIIILQIGSTLKHFLSKVCIAFIPSTFLMLTTALITSIHNIGFQPYLALALYPFLLMVMSFASEHVESDSKRIFLNTFPIALMVGYVFIGLILFLILSQY